MPDEGRDQIIEEISREIKNMRGRDGYLRRIKGAATLFAYAGCATASVEYKVSCLITLIRAFLSEKETRFLLASLNLLEEYSDFDTADKRREQCLIDMEPDKNEKERLSLSMLRKADDHAIEFLADCIVKAKELGTIEMLLKAAPEERGLKHCLPKRFPYYVERGMLLQNMRDSFCSGETGSSTQIIYGLGGVGKTQIAREYAHRYISEYPVICWMTAETRESMYGPAVEFVEYVNPNEYKRLKDSPGALVKTFRQWFENHNGWLLIFDNVEDTEKMDIMDVIEPFNPHNPNGHILITTRQTGSDTDNTIPVNVFDQDVAVAFLLRRAGSKDTTRDQPYAAAIAERLGCLPLALTQAAVYIRKKLNSSFAEYLTLLEDRGLKVFKSFKKSVSLTWEISIEKMPAGAKQLLYMCAYFAPENIDFSIFVQRAKALADAASKGEKQVGGKLPIELCHNLIEPEDRDSLIEELTQYSLMSCEHERGTLSIHRLVQEAIREKLGDDTSYIKHCLLLVPVVLNNTQNEIEEPNPGFFDYIRYTLPHLCSIMGHGESCLSEDTEFLKIAWLGYEMIASFNKLLGNTTEQIAYLKKEMAYAKAAYYRALEDDAF